MGASVSEGWQMLLWLEMNTFGQKMELILSYCGVKILNAVRSN